MFTDETYQFNGKTYHYWHKGAWADTERAAEIPIAKQFMAKGGSILEVGNVMRPHFPKLDHLVIDLDEKRDGWENYENADVLTYQPEQAVGRVLTISTLEHTNDMVAAIRRVLSWSDNVLISVPLGYNTPGGYHTNAAVFEHDYPAELSVLAREKSDPHRWFEMPPAEARELGFAHFQYGRDFRIGASAIALFHRNL